jgi:TRAP-type uncharacterized transport system substrate-binding protein
MDALYANELDIICDEGIPTMWFNEALEQGMQPITLDDETVYKVCAAIHVKDDAIPWDGDSYTDINKVWQETEATPVDVPFHPGALQWYKDQAAGV